MTEIYLHIVARMATDTQLFVPLRRTDALVAALRSPPLHRSEEELEVLMSWAATVEFFLTSVKNLKLRLEVYTISSVISKPCMTEIYLNVRCAQYRLYVPHAASDLA